MNDNDATPLLEIAGLAKWFGANEALSGIDLVVNQGDSLVLIGSSGSGKTLLLKCIMGLIPHDAGTIRFQGRDVGDFSDRERDEFIDNFGMTFQKSGLFDSMPVWENVAFGLIQGRGMSRDDAKGVALTKMAQVGLGEEVGELGPAELSGGMQKRVGLARAIATEPEIIFFDEPTTGLDPIMGDVINDLIVDCVKELGATTLSITHDLASARKIADRIAMIYKGQIIWAGPTDQIDQSGNAHVDQFIHGRAEGPIQMEVLRP